MWYNYLEHIGSSPGGLGGIVFRPRYQQPVMTATCDAQIWLSWTAPDLVKGQVLTTK